MTQQIRRGVAAAAGVAAGFAATATQAQVVYKPTQDAVTEKQLLQKLDQVTGRVSIPDARAGVLIQPQGRTFREAQTEWMPTIAAIAIFGMLLIVAAFYLLKGRIRLRNGFSGLTIVRFGGIERFAHWLTASSFLILAFTGLNTAFGRALLLPLMSERAFASMTETLKVVHNYTGFAFIAGVVLVTVLWIKDNFLSRADIEWIKEFGGLFNGKHVPADKFNFGQKVMFWSVVLLGGALAVTGLQLLFPFRWMAIDGMQWALAIHALFGVLFFASIIAHIYIGTLGMEGAFDAMGSGRVDVNWAKEHHALWAEDALKTQTPEPDGAARPMPAE